MPLKFNKQIGGAESNVAIGLAKLGHKVGWFSKLGDDPFGRYVRNFIRGEGVDTSRCIFTNSASTGIFFKEKKTEELVNVYYYRKGSAASEITPGELAANYIGNSKILHITGITPALSDSAYETVLKAIEIAKEKHVKISFDPNIRLKLMEFKKIKKRLLTITENVDYVLTGIHEGQLLTDEQSSEKIAESFMQIGAKTIVVKLGANGAFYKTNVEEGYVDSFKVNKVVDPVGAGDGFTAGFLSGILLHKQIREAVRMGNAVGSYVVQVNGDVEGLPTLNDVFYKLQAEDVNNSDVIR